jgi:hypothetical protein
MSVTEQDRATEPDQSEHQCVFCGAQLARDQEWCLECGAARTLIHRTPDWRVPLAVIGTVALLVLIALAIALVNLSGQANRDAQRQSPAATASRSPVPAPRTTGAAVPSPIATWPTGLSGWTVVIAQRHRQARAINVARRFTAAGIAVGVLNSSEHPTMPPGYWIVFAGRYPDEASASAAAAKLRASGHPRAVARRVAPPGGI